MAAKLPTTEILARIRRNSEANSDEIFTKMFRYLLRTDIWYEAYKHLYANNGAATKGVNEDTADGFSEAKVKRIIQELRSGNYQPTPVRRTYIAKKSNPSKKRPLGIPTFTDKLVQEVLRMVLEAIYEPVFLDCSHGFRPERSSRTALKSLRLEFAGARWFIEGDIKGCFDAIDHSVLVGLIGKKVKDARLIELVHKFLKAGYMENWVYHETYSGAPQGGIISPLLENICLHELDKFVMQLKAEYDVLSKQLYTHEYQQAKYRTEKARKAIRKYDGDDKVKKRALVKQLHAARSVQLKTPSKLQTDKKIKYIRYADDFIIAVNGNHEDCVEIKRKLTEFVGATLKMELSQEKTLITHSNNYARFLGYDVRVRRNGQIKPKGNTGVTVRSLNNTVELLVPLQDKINRFLFAKKVVIQKPNGTMFPVHRPYLISMSDLEVISTYNAELRGICNYYALASNYCQLRYFAYLMEYSCLKTLAGRHRTSISKIIGKYSDGMGGWGISYDTKTGKKRCYFAKYSDCRNAKECSDTVANAAVMYGYTRNTFEKRLNAKICELCGDTTADHYEVHHVHKVKDLSGKAAWERAMIAKRRKTLVVCQACHHMIHNQ